jgi:hypothetical protein
VVYVTGPDGQTISQQTTAGSVAQMPDPLSLPVSAPPVQGGPQPLGNVQESLSNVAYLTGYAGVSITGQVANLSGSYQGYQDTNVSDYHALINWGDSGRWDPAQLVSLNGSIQVIGTHTYNQAGTYQIVVYVAGPDGQTLSQQTTAASIANLPGGGGNNGGGTWQSNVQTAVINAANQFYQGFTGQLDNLWKFMTNDPVANQKAIANGIYQYMTNDPDKNHQALAGFVQQGLQQVKANPAKALGALTFNLALGKFLGLFQSGLTAEATVVEGVTDESVGSGYLGSNALPAGSLQAASLNQKILTDLIRNRMSAVGLGAQSTSANCALYAKVLDDILKGDWYVGPVPAVPNGLTYAEVANLFGGKWVNGGTLTQLNTALRQLPTGTTGIVAIPAPPGATMGHVINFVKINGKVVFVDSSIQQLVTTLAPRPGGYFYMVAP